MRELKQVWSSRFSRNKGFVFTLEALIAFILLVSFLEIASIEQLPKEDYLQRVELKQELNDTIAVLDENGFLLQTIDRNGLSAGEKMDLIYEKVTGLLPSNYKARIELADYNANKTACQASPTFNDCFELKGLYPAIGPSLPSDKSVSHERLLLIKKQPAPQCEIGQVFSWKEEKEEMPIEPKASKAFLKANVTKMLFAPYTGPLFFQEAHDFNAILGVKVTPSDEASCDSDIRIDLNISVPDYGRYPADIILTIDRSGSMDEVTVNNGNFGHGSFNNGTKTVEWGGCSNYGNWQNIGSFTINEELAEEDEVGIRMYYTGYAGECSRPRMRIQLPGGSYYPSSSGSSSSSPITISLNYPSQGNYTVQGWSDDTINYDVNMYVRKIYAAQEAGKNFVNYEEWRQPLDRLGLISFASDASTSQYNQQLLMATDINKAIIVEKIDGLVANGATNTGEGIRETVDELISARGNSSALKFGILLTDGGTSCCSGCCSNPSSCHNYCWPDVVSAVAYAKSNNIVFYTIAFGSDAATYASDLQYIAEQTGGEYKSAEEEESLQSIYDWIKIDIGSRVSTLPPEKAYDTNVMIPVERCSDIVDVSNGQCENISDQNYMWYDIGYIDKINPWDDYFVINIPCNAEDACETNYRTFPPDGTNIQYVDENGFIKSPLLWDENVTIKFNYRDLTVRILRAVILGPNLIYVDVNSANVGALDATATELHYYADDPYAGILIKQQNVPGLGAGAVHMIYDDEINEEGWIYAVINPEGNVRECPGNNVAEIYCSGTTETQYFVLDIWAWR